MNKTIEQGSTLIIVLFILILITLIGAIAVKSSTIGLRLATNNQAGQLLMEVNDSAFFGMENPNPIFIEQMVAAGGLYSYFSDAKNAKDELVLCYDAKKAQPYRISSRGVIRENGTISGDGFCKKNTFSTGRDATITQIHLTKAQNNQNPGDGLPKGTSTGSGGIPIVNEYLMAVVVSAIPSFSNVDISNCFKLSAQPQTEELNNRIVKKQTVQECLQQNNIPYNAQNMEFRITNQPEVKK